MNNFPAVQVLYCFYNFCHIELGGGKVARFVFNASIQFLVLFRRDQAQ